VLYSTYGLQEGMMVATKNVEECSQLQQGSHTTCDMISLQTQETDNGQLSPQETGRQVWPAQPCVVVKV